MNTRKPKKRTVIVALWLAGSAGRKQLTGILRYVNAGRPWTVRLITDPKDFTDDVLATAEREKVDGIIVHADARSANGLATSAIPTVLMDFPPPKLARRTKAVSVILDSDEAIGEMAANYLLGLGSFASYAFVPDSANRGWSRLRERGFERTLRKRIRQLEAELAAAPAPTNAPTEGVIQPLPARGEFRSPSLYERMKNFKENDPKKYEHMRQQAAQHRQMWLQRTQGRLDYLSSLDTSGMTSSERANHEKLQELLAQREKLPVLDPTEVSEEEMRAAWRESMQLEDEIRKASAAERETLFRQTAAALGLEGEDAQALTETIREVIEVPGGNQGGPRRPRGGRPPAPPQGN